jgi:uncharacterized protein YndB with AHSA1/START domain
VFRALTDPDEVAKWWGPRGFTSPNIDWDLRVGGRYRIAMQPPDGDLFHLSGEFRELDPPNRLAYTFVWEEPDPDDVENVVTLTLADQDDSTELAVDQAPFKTEARLELHNDGWTDGLERLHALFASRAD